MEKPAEQSWAEEKSSNTRRQLILAGMRLMAKHGIDGVSLRAVNVEAGARNSSATHYHFGNKLGLIEAIVDTIARDEALVRRPRMLELDQRPPSEPVSPREVVEAGYLPFLGLFYHPEYGLPAIRFLSRLIVDTAPDIRVVVNRFTTPFANDVFELLTRALPDVPPYLLKTRILFSLINLINGASDAFSLSYSPFGDMSYANPLELAHHFLDYIVAGLSAPPSEPTEEFMASCMRHIELLRDAGIEGAEGTVSADER